MNKRILKFAGYEIKDDVHYAKLKLVLLHILALAAFGLSILMSLTITTELVIFYLAAMFYKFINLLISENKQKAEIEEQNRLRTDNEKKSFQFSGYAYSFGAILVVLSILYIVTMALVLCNENSSEVLKQTYIVTVVVGIIFDMLSNIISNIVTVLGGNKLVVVNYN